MLAPRVEVLGGAIRGSFWRRVTRVPRNIDVMVEVHHCNREFTFCVLAFGLQSLNRARQFFMGFTQVEEDEFLVHNLSSWQLSPTGLRLSGRRCQAGRDRTNRIVRERRSTASSWHGRRQRGPTNCPTVW